MGKSPDEQPSLAVYKLRLASANSMATPLGVTLMLKEGCHAKFLEGLNTKGVVLELALASRSL